MLAFILLNAILGTAIAVAVDMHEGIIDRFRSLPMSRAGILLMFALAFVSTAIVPTNHMVGWLRDFTYWNPVSVLATACRHLFGNPNPAASSAAWTIRHPLAASIIWSVAIIAVFAPTAVQLYQTRTSRQTRARSHPPE